MEIHHGYDGNDHPESWIKKNWWIWVFQNPMKFKHAHMDGRFHKRSRILDEIFQHAPPEVVIHLAPEKLYIFLKKVKDPLPSIHHFLKGFQNCWTSGDVKVHIQGANGVDQPYPWWCWCFFFCAYRLVKVKVKIHTLSWPFLRFEVLAMMRMEKIDKDIFSLNGGLMVIFFPWDPNPLKKKKHKKETHPRLWLKMIRLPTNMGNCQYL